MPDHLSCNESNKREKHNLGLLSFCLFYHTRTFQQTMGPTYTRVHYINRVNASTCPHNSSNVKTLIELKEKKLHYFCCYLRDLDRGGEKFNPGFLL